MLKLRDSPVPVVEDEEVAACQKGGEHGNVSLEYRGKLKWECEVEGGQQDENFADPLRFGAKSI